MEDVQEIIEQLRRRRWTMAAIAREMGTTDMTINRWWRGTVVPANQVAVAKTMRQLLSEPAPQRKYRRRGRPRGRHE